jgi:hypothetical protein
MMASPTAKAIGVSDTDVVEHFNAKALSEGARQLL